MPPFAIESLLGLIKALMATYDVVTLPVYVIFQKPWVCWIRKRACFAKPMIEGDPTSPYKRLKSLEFEMLKGVETVDEFTRKAIHAYYRQPAIGTRPVLSCTEKELSCGKVFKQLTLGDYEWLTYEEVDRKIDLTARGLLSIGVRPRQCMAILAETRAEWFITAQACFRTNVPLVTLYATLSNEGIVSAINETEVTHLVTSEDLLPRVLNIVDRMPSLTHIVYMESAQCKSSLPAAQGLQVIPFRSLETLQTDYETEQSPPTRDDVAIIMYTSGSTSAPKGVMATHRNLMATINAFGILCKTYGVGTTEDTYIAYLPLAHVLELSAETVMFGIGTRIGYSSPLTLTDKSPGIAPGCHGDAILLKPTTVTCVPLVADRLRKAINEAAASKGPFFSAFFDYAVKYKNFWLEHGFDTPLLNRFLFNKTRLALGGRARFVVSGSAPLSSHTHRFMRACLGCHVVEGYGLTETTSAATVMEPGDMSTGRVGAPLSGCYVRLVDWNEGRYSTSDKPNPRGEIVVGGDCVAKGYFKKEELTREAFREESGIRWFHTGDIGEIFPDGTLKIVDRKKDLVKLQHGEYVALARVESVLKACPLVDNALVYGNSLHTYLVALVTPNYDKLHAIARRLGKEDSATLRSLCDDVEVCKAAEVSILEFARASGLQKTEIPYKVKLCAEEWVPDSGLVTPTLKVCRKPLQRFYQNDIDAMYKAGEESRLRHV
ncbi:long-chain-fatty-acid--CoA ligase 4-like [Dermacentor albipictus]|uniref:long-chain-fatty-acid--CoA ligase 4-like n=1 Tax=Dermacentor albipictus TaxID=60249 RepID=UPI0038FC1194